MTYSNYRSRQTTSASATEENVASSSSVVFGHRRRFAKATEGMARKTKAEAQV
jgi:hypothetical protein